MTLYSRDLNKIDNIKQAIAEAERFVEKARVAQSALRSEEEMLYHSKSFAAAKRASMDLTRALAKMRGTAA